MLHVVVVYLDQGTTSDVLVPVTLLDQRITATAGTQSLPLTIDLTRCLADPRHVPPGPNCQLFAAVTLLQNGSVIDSVSVGPVTVTPGQTVHANTSLTPIGHVDVYPPSATVSVGATTQLFDTVFSPTDSILPGTSVAWTSRNTAVATVDTGGLVTGVGAGTTTVVASVGGQQDSATITVTATSTGGGITFPGLPGDSVTFQAPPGGTLPAPGIVPVASADTTVVTNLVATISPASATAWLVANVSDSSFGSRVTHLPRGIRTQTIRRQTSGSGVTTPAALDVHPTTTNLTAGTYTATVTVAGSGGASGSIKVSYTIVAAQPALAFQPNPVLFNQYDSGSTIAAASSATAINSGSGGTLGQLSESGNIAYTGPDTGWLAINSVSGTTITVQPKTTSLHVGTDTANIPFNAVGASNNPQNLTVLVTSWVTYTKVVLGASFGCGLTTAGTVYCWGGAAEGELGDNGPDLGITTPQRALIPYSPTNPVIDIEAGSYHACALLQNGQAYCWGENNRGQVGVGSGSGIVSTPTLVPGQTFGQITLGADHTCGIIGTPPLAGANYVYCWGDNTDGEFGNNLPTTNVQSTPLNTGLIYYAISAGNLFTCGINNKAVGGLYCWGNNGFGQMGNGTTGTFYSAPVKANVLTATGGPAVVTSVSAGGTTVCAVDNAGNGYCWGDNTYGEVGDGNTTTPVNTPTVIPGGISFTSISVGFSSVCGIASNADYCWGYNNYGQLGNGQTANSSQPSPGQVNGSGQLFTEFVVGEGSQSAAYITGGVVYTFGFNSNGQLGNGTQNNTSGPTPMFGQPAPAGVGPSRVVPKPAATARRRGRT